MGASYADLLAVARTAEQCGFDAFFRSEHYLAFPADHHMGGRAMAGSYGLPAATDAWVTLAGLARDTTRIRSVRWCRRSPSARRRYWRSASPR